MSIWTEFKKRFSECGILYGISTVGVDGVFLGIEIGTGLAFLRGVRFVATLLPNGRVRVELIDVDGHKLGEADWSEEALAAKYGEPQQTHVGGHAPDANRQIPDRSADDILRDKREREAAEQRARREDERADGSYRDRNDPDGVRRAPDGEAMIQDRNGDWKRVSEMGRPNNVYTGRWGETVADDYANTQGWQKVNGEPTTMQSGFTGPSRIDSIYRDPGPPPRYIVSDAKALGSGQGKTADGLQMSQDWIEKRLKNAGLSRQNIDGIRDGHNPVLLRVDKNGNVTEVWLDTFGKPIPAPVWRNK